MQNLLEMDVKSHEAWLKKEFHHIWQFVFQYAYAPLTFDLDLVSEYHRAGFLSADVGKTIDRVLKFDLLQTVIKLTFVANLRFIH